MTKPDVNITTRGLAELIPVDPSTVRRWVEGGKLTPAVITPGGHFRFNTEDALEQISRIGQARTLEQVAS